MFKYHSYLISGCIALMVVLVGLSAEAKDEGQESKPESLTVTEELLQTLRREGKLSEVSYQKLIARHEEERKAKKREKKKDWKFKWKNGLRFERRDGQHKLKIAGHMQNDWALIDYDSDTAQAEGIDDEDLFSGTEFRRARIAFTGQLYRRVGFKAQVDFSNGGADFKGMWVSLRKLGPLGELKIGQVREPFSLEGMTGSKYLTFMERALPNALVPDRGTGFKFMNAPLDGRVTWSVAALRRTDDTGRDFSGDSAYDVGARVTALPLYREKGKHLIHVGASYIHQFRSGDETVQYRARPEAALARRLINTGNLDTRGQDLFGVELAVVSGPFSFQSEMIGSIVNQRAGSEAFLWGAYGMATLSLTGEHRVFKKDSATFGRLEPTHDFNPEKGHWGAWELAARVSYLDLDDGDVEGGQLRDVTAGVNWYLYSNFRWMLNYVLSDVKGAGITNIGLMRFQFDF